MNLLSSDSLSKGVEKIVIFFPAGDWPRAPLSYCAP